MLDNYKPEIKPTEPVEPWPIHGGCCAKAKTEVLTDIQGKLSGLDKTRASTGDIVTALQTIKPLLAGALLFVSMCVVAAVEPIFVPHYRVGGQVMVMTNMQEWVESGGGGGGGGGADTNSVRKLIDASFDGGTQNVNRVIGCFDALTNSVGGIEDAVATIESRTNVWDSVSYKRDKTDLKTYIAEDVSSSWLYTQGTVAGKLTFNRISPIGDFDWRLSSPYRALTYSPSSGIIRLTGSGGGVLAIWQGPSDKNPNSADPSVNDLGGPYVTNDIIVAFNRMMPGVPTPDGDELAKVSFVTNRINAMTNNFEACVYQVISNRLAEYSVKTINPYTATIEEICVNYNNLVRALTGMTNQYSFADLQIITDDPVTLEAYTVVNLRVSLNIISSICANMEGMPVQLKDSATQTDIRNVFNLQKAILSTHGYAVSSIPDMEETDVLSAYIEKYNAMARVLKNIR